MFPVLASVLICSLTAPAQLDLVQAVNEARVENGVTPLKVDDNLTKCAQDFAGELGRTGRFSHEGEDGSTPGSRSTKAGYMGLVAENISLGHDTAEKAVAGWLKSEGHRRNLLNPNYRFIGVGSADHPRGPVWVLDLGTSDLAFPVILDLDSPRTSSEDVRVDVSEPGLAREMRVVIDGSPILDWQPFQPMFRLRLPGTGSHEVTVEMRGAAGWTHTSRSRIMSSR